MSVRAQCRASADWPFLMYELGFRPGIVARTAAEVRLGH
jgi:hypothetical protein